MDQKVTFMTRRSQLERLDRWRARQSPIPSRNAAMRDLLDRQLDAENIPFNGDDVPLPGDEQ